MSAHRRDEAGGRRAVNVADADYCSADNLDAANEFTDVFGQMGTLQNAKQLLLRGIDVNSTATSG